MTRHAPTFFFVQLLCCITAVQSFSLKNCTIGYSENVVEVLCQNYALKQIPDDIPQNTNQLDLSFNKISEIKITDLGHLPELVSLLVNDNQLYHIDDYAFAELKELKCLRLSHNKLTSLTDHMFEGLDKLASLYLDHNNISQVSPHAFQPLAGLHNVKLDWNHIDNIRDIATLFQLPNVELISLTQNHITSFDSDDLPFNTSNVKSLVFESNKLQKFSLKRDIFPYLRSIDLYNSAWFTEWDVVNKTFLRSVTEISLGGRFISLDAYTDMLHSTSSLQKLDLAAMNRNKLNISIDIACSIPSLRTLELTFNVLYVIDDNLLKLCSHLTELTLSLNNLKELSDQSLKSLTQIRLLALNENNLPKVPLAIRGLSTLEILDLSVNFISEIDCLVFVNLTKLTTLDLRKNRIVNLQECIFQKLHNLNSLDISKNMVHSLDYVFRVNMSKLKTLILSENSAHLLLKQGEFMTLSSLRVLELHSGTYYLSQNGAFEGLNHLKILILSINGYSNKLFEGLTQLENLQLHLRFIRNMRDNQNVNENNEDPPFSGLPNLKILSLKVYDQFTVVPSPDLLSGLKSLQSLSADNFFQNSIHQDTFKYTPQLLKLRIINSNLLVLPPELFQPLHNLQQLDLSNNKFQSLDFLANLKVLHWLKDKKQLPVKNDTISQTLAALIHPDTLNYTLHLLSLPVINRDLSVLPPELFQSIQNLRQLDLSNNSFQSLDFLANLKALQWVKATKNQLSVINETTFHTLPALTYLDVTNNPLSCECSNAGFKQWTLTNNQTQVINGHQYKCAFPVSQQKNRFLDFDTRSCWIDYGFICFTSSSCLLLLTLFVSFVYNFLRWQLAYAYYLFLAYVYDTKNRKKGTGHLYDAFISYNVHDEDWVYTEMLPVLEGEQGWRLCLHHRDFEPGKPIVENITDAIYGSRKTICVISRHYLQSGWCSREIQMASVRLFEAQKDVLILVFLEDIPTWQLSPYYQMRRLVKKRTYLSWPQAAQHKGVFWQKINQALKTGNNPNDNKHLIIEQEDV